MPAWKQTLPWVALVLLVVGGPLSTYTHSPLWMLPAFCAGLMMMSWSRYER